METKDKSSILTYKCNKKKHCIDLCANYKGDQRSSNLVETIQVLLFSPLAHRLRFLSKVILEITLKILLWCLRHHLFYPKNIQKAEILRVKEVEVARS